MRALEMHSGPFLQLAHAPPRRQRPDIPLQTSRFNTGITSDQMKLSDDMIKGRSHRHHADGV